MTTPLKIPQSIARLEELANNLWWSWHDEARKLFQSLDYPLWREAGQNPVKLLREISPKRLQDTAANPAFLQLYQSVISAFDADISLRGSWFLREFSGRVSGPIAYFSPEFAFHKSLPIYAGGLGVLAGDTCKEACDLGLPLLGVGFMYPQGYFRQRISPDGLQEETYEQINFDEAPISLYPWPQSRAPLLKVQLPGRPLCFRTWQVRLGRVKVYLLDTNVERNTPVDRQLSAHLYTADREQRLQQEIALGIGGVRLLRVLGIEPSVWHANEGHTAFMMLERLREYVDTGVSFSEAVDAVCEDTIFTTHTPVPAGHDVFPAEMMDKYFHDYWGSHPVDWKKFMDLGNAGDSGGQHFNMTALGLKLAGQSCGVSRLHGKVAQRMWHVLWPSIKESKVPISSVTNGIHLSSWVSKDLYRLWEKYLGKELVNRQDDAEFWQKLFEIPDAELWAARQTMKRRLMRVINDRAQRRWAEGGVTAEQVLIMGALLDPDRLTIGFVRRFAEYKRPTLLFHDTARLRRIINNPACPVQIIFAGKSHPADFPSKYLLRGTYNLAKDRDFQGRIAFVEDYDIQIARYLVSGIDVWLNTPRRLQEACGTSGMKASVNGAAHFSVRDGWWHEAFNGKNGWAIGPETVDPSQEDDVDAESLYRMLENKIVPLYYDRDVNGVPHGWVSVVKNAISSVVPAFCATRMLKQYAERMYVPAAEAHRNRQSISQATKT